MKEKSIKEINRYDLVTPFTYIFVREDLEPVQQLIQAGHAIHKAGFQLGRHSQYEEDFDRGGFNSTHFCVFGVKDLAELESAVSYLMHHEVKFQEFYEPDVGNLLTAVVSEPLIGTKRKLMEGFKPLRMPQKRKRWWG